jgi:2-methylcitrate dehydratase PrpD
VQITEDPEMSAAAPRLRPARVTLTLGDGRQATHVTESHRGDFNAPFAESEIREKFRELAATVLTPAGAAEVERAVDRCEEWKSVGELPALLRQNGR